MLVLFPMSMPVLGSDGDADTMAPATPSLVFEAERQRATEGFLFTTVEIPFRVRNEASHPVRILEIAPRRGAGRGSAEPEVLQPGASGRVILRRQITELGVREHSFRVRTDDRKQKDYPLKASILGMSAYTPDLPSAHFDVVRKGRTTAQRITISSYETPRLDLKSVLESPPWAEVVAVPRAEGVSSQDLEIEVRVLSSAPKGLLKGSAHLLTTATAQPDLVVPVQARVFESISVGPMPATFKPAHVGETRKLELEYRSLDGKSLELDKVTDSTGALHLVARPCGANCVKVVAEYATTRVGEFGGTIHARFLRRDETMEVGWDILVVKDSATLMDLGTLGGDAEAIEERVEPGTPGGAK